MDYKNEEIIKKPNLRTHKIEFKCVYYNNDQMPQSFVIVKNVMLIFIYGWFHWKCFDDVKCMRTGTRTQQQQQQQQIIIDDNKTNTNNVNVTGERKKIYSKWIQLINCPILTVRLLRGIGMCCKINRRRIYTNTQRHTIHPL